MNELLYKADVCIVEISHVVDHRLLEFTKLQKQWFKKLESYLDEESKKENLQATIQVRTKSNPKIFPKLCLIKSWPYLKPDQSLRTKPDPNLTPKLGPKLIPSLGERFP